MHGEGIVQTTNCARVGSESYSGTKILSPQGGAGSNPAFGTKTRIDDVLGVDPGFMLLGCLRRGRRRRNCSYRFEPRAKIGAAGLRLDSGICDRSVAVARERTS